ncbi:MAG: hypothetical protein RLZZ28_2022 [Bacteroidota bacterium]|jgi:hypothetical protein
MINPRKLDLELILTLSKFFMKYCRFLLLISLLVFSGCGSPAENTLKTIGEKAKTAACVSLEKSAQSCLKITCTETAKSPGATIPGSLIELSGQILTW